MQLQQTIGNQAVGRLLSGMAQEQTNNNPIQKQVQEEIKIGDRQIILDLLIIF